MNTKWVLVMIAAGCTSSSLKPGKEPADAPSLTTLRSFLEREMEVNGLPSLVVVVADKNRILAAEAVGLADRKEHRAADVDAFYRIGSVTKLFTGTALMALKEQGKLGLDDPVSRFIPEIAGVVHPPGDMTPITLRHLVAHLSGLPREFPPLSGKDPDGPMSENDVLAALQGEALLAAPGTQRIYSNQAMALVGVVIARAAGMPFREVVQQRVLGPLGLRCVWDEKDVPLGKLAQGYALGDAGDVPGRRLKEGAKESDGGLYCSARDLVRFGQLFLHVTPGEDERALATSTRLQARDERINWGCNDVEGLGRSCGHSGLIDDYSTDLHLFMDRKTLVVTLTNASAAMPNSAIAGKVARGMLGGQPWKLLETPEVPVFLPEAQAHFQAILTGPVTARLMQDHVIPEQFKMVGGVDVLVQLVTNAAKKEGTCWVERVVAAGRAGQLVAIKECANGAEHHRERCTLMGQEPLPPHRIGLFSCDTVPGK